jgi:hypothetical protein
VPVGRGVCITEVCCTRARARAHAPQCTLAMMSMRAHARQVHRFSNISKRQSFTISRVCVMPKHPRVDSNSSSECDTDDAAVEAMPMLLAKYHLQSSSRKELERGVERRQRRRVALMRCAASVVACCACVVKDYVRYRGGLNQLRNYVCVKRAFNPRSFDDKMFVSYFRFEREEVEEIIDRLKLPSHVVSVERDRAPTFDVFCMMCCKFAFPQRYCQLMREFNRSESALSRLVRSLRQLLYSRYNQAMRNPRPLSAEECACFSSCISKICGMPTVVGFIDGTVREICKPGVLQGPMYNGKDRKHALKYQAVNTPDGMIAHLAGPYPGSRHDQFMLADSRIREWIGTFPDHPEHGTPYVIYADAGYVRTPGIEIPYYDAELNASHDGFNRAMSSTRISIEWAFGAILSHWASLRFVPGQKLMSNGRIGQIYFVAALLTNFMNCMRPNATSQYFNIEPPSLMQYISILNNTAAAREQRGLFGADLSSSSSSSSN